MSTVAVPGTKLMTVEEFLALPDDGRERWLIRGELRPKEPALSVRNRKHSQVELTIGHLLRLWFEQQPGPRGALHSGDAGFRLRRGEASSLVGIDVAYASAELVAATAEDAAYYDGPPVLAVEILSPSDKHEEIVEKIREYLEAGAVVWEVDPDFRRVTVHRPGHEPVMSNAAQELAGDPYLPGFRVPVAHMFAP